MTMHTPSLQDQLRGHLAATGESMRGLSLRAGLNEKAVANILEREAGRPRATSVDALSSATGLDLVASTSTGPLTYAALIRRLTERAHSGEEKAVARRLASRLGWLVRKAGWVAETKIVDRREVVEYFAARTPATFGISPGSLSTYKTDILRAMGSAPRPRGVADLHGLWGELRDLVRADETIPLDQKNVWGSLLVWLHDRGVEPEAVTTGLLAEYYEHRLSCSTASKAKVKAHVKRSAALLVRLSANPNYDRFGIPAVAHPFEDGCDRFGVRADEIAALMNEWDSRVAPWVQGLVSATGQSREHFIRELDARKEARAPVTVLDRKKARLASRRAGKKERRASERGQADFAQAGFLLPKQCWSPTTLKNRRAFVVAGAKALLRDGFLVESLEELTDPDVVEELAEALAEANDSEHGSEYVRTGLSGILKVARFVGRSEEHLKEIAGILDDHDPCREGLAPRNVAKLQQFTAERQTAFANLSATLLDEINAQLTSRRKAARQKAGRDVPLAEVYNADLAQRVMLVLAHDILLARAPRSANVVGIPLDWIRWRDGQATIVVPAEKVKGREACNPDLPIPLGPEPSRLLRSYLDHVRPLALGPGDELNPFLFPSQGGGTRTLGQPYQGLLKRLCREVHCVVGVKVNPHLYRHMIGWMWLKEDPKALPMVSKVLGHKSLDTTLKSYAQIDEAWALAHWHEHLDKVRTRASATAHAMQERVRSATPGAPRPKLRGAR